MQKKLAEVKQTAATKQNVPRAQKPSPSINSPPTAAPTTMLALVTDAEIARSVPRASGTCSVSSVVFDAKRAPITADSRRLRNAVAGSGNARFVCSRRSIPEIRTLPATIASDAINDGLQRVERERHQLFVEDTAPWAVHAITSPRYARVHHDELASRVLDLMALHPAWHLPLGYKDGEFGAERVPSGAYLGDRDMFLFLVDGNRDLDDPTDRTHAGLFRGFILRNSDVGAAALTLDVFLFRLVCGNHIIWGFQHVAGFRRRHVGASIQDAWTTSLNDVRTALDADTADDRTRILRAGAFVCSVLRAPCSPSLEHLAHDHDILPILWPPRGFF